MDNKEDEIISQYSKLVLDFANTKTIKGASFGLFENMRYAFNLSHDFPRRAKGLITLSNTAHPNKSVIRLAKLVVHKRALEDNV